MLNSGLVLGLFWNYRCNWSVFGQSFWKKALKQKETRNYFEIGIHSEIYPAVITQTYIGYVLFLFFRSWFHVKRCGCDPFQHIYSVLGLIYSDKHCFYKHNVQFTYVKTIVSYCYYNTSDILCFHEANPGCPPCE